jgi:hypothetical protein
VQSLVGFYCDLLKADGVPRSDDQVGHVAKRVRKLVDDGVPAQTITEALRLMHEKQLNPSTLPSLITEATLGPRRDNEHPADRMARVLREAGMRDTSRIDDIDGDAYEIADEDDH